VNGSIGKSRFSIRAASYLSPISILIALVAVSLNALFARPYGGAAYYADENKSNIYKRKEILGKIANYFIVIGTAGQFI
jgi:CRISPR/Cas system-associated protein Cas7 (RAMP superfamily)